MAHLILDNTAWGDDQKRSAAEHALATCRNLFGDPRIRHYVMAALHLKEPEVDWLRKQGTTCVGPLWEVKLSYELDQWMKELDPPGHAHPDPGTLAGGRYSYPDIDMLHMGQPIRIEMKAWWIQSEEASGRFKEPLEEIKPQDVLVIPYWDFTEGKSGHPLLLDTLCVSAWEAAFLRNKRTTEAGGTVEGRSAQLANGKRDTNFGKLDRLNHQEVNDRSRYYPSPRRLASAFDLNLPGTNEDYHVLFSEAEGAIDAAYPTADALHDALHTYGETQTEAQNSPRAFELMGMFYRLWQHLSPEHKAVYGAHAQQHPSLKSWLARAWWIASE